MAPPHTMSPSKSPSKLARPRPGPLTMPANVRSIRQARLSTTSYFQPAQPSMPGEDENSIIKQFRLHRATNSSKIDNKDDETQRCISYTKEHKLAAISYTIITWIANKDGSMKPISKYCACMNFNITLAMLQD